MRPTWTVVVAVPICVGASLLDGTDRQVRLRVGHGKAASGDNATLPPAIATGVIPCAGTRPATATHHIIALSIHLKLGSRLCMSVEPGSSLLYLLPCTSGLTCNSSPHGAMMHSHSKVQRKARLVSSCETEHACVTAHNTQQTGALDGVYAGADRAIGQLMRNATLCHGQVGAQDSLALMVSQIEHVWQASSKRLDLVHEDIPAVQVTLHIMCAMSGYQCNGLWFQCKRFWQQCKGVSWAGGGGGGGKGGGGGGKGGGGGR